MKKLTSWPRGDGMNKLITVAAAASLLLASPAHAHETPKERVLREHAERSVHRVIAVRRVSSTAYCLRGRMASGKRTYDGAVAMNGVPLGSRWRVRETGRVYRVEDRIGHGSQFDIAMPGRCAEARRYGRRTITVERLS